MQSSSIPTKFPIPWGNAAAGAFIRTIPTGSQIGIQDGAASLTDGFVPDNFTPVSAGGVPPFGQDMNGILRQITQWSQWYSAGGPINWDAAFSLSIGGYPRGAVVGSNTVFGYSFISLIENNTDNPDVTTVNWAPFSPQGGATTGDVQLTYKTVANPGWIIVNDGSIGSAASGATFASALAQPLYVLIWNNVSNTWAPVPGGRGANAAADFAANKPLTMPPFLGRVPGVAGGGSGLTARALGQTFGEENHVLNITEIPAHAHGVNESPHSHTFTAANATPSAVGGGGNLAAVNQANVTAGAVTGLTIQNTGGGGGHNTMQPTSFLNVMIKL